MKHSCEKDCDRPCKKTEVNVIYADKKYDCEHLLGQFVDKEHYDLLITEDSDVYAPTMDGSRTEDNIVAMFRKNVFTQEELEQCYEGLIGAATQSQNRGLAAGPRGDVLKAEGRGGREWVTPFQISALEYLTRPENELVESVTLKEFRRLNESKKAEEETRGYVWLRSKVMADHDPYFGWFDRWLDRLDNLPRDEQRKEAEYVRDNYISATNYAQSVMSGVAGYYSRYPRIPYGRATAFTEKHPESFAKSFPYLRKLNHCFSELLPNRWAAQRAAADKLDKRFLIDDTVFTTLTVNHNFRTACHRDAGDLDSGFSNLSALGKGWDGAELILPEYRVAVKLEPGDLLLVANHTAIHGNAPLSGDNPDRMTIVAYFREDMLECKSWEYEQLRKQFIDQRRLNEKHPLWRPLWNGVSPSWETSQEWYDYLHEHGMTDPYGKDQVSTLENFF